MEIVYLLLFNSDYILRVYALFFEGLNLFLPLTFIFLVFEEVNFIFGQYGLELLFFKSESIGAFF